MTVLTIVICWLLIGAVIGLKDSELIDDIIKNAKEKHKGAPSWEYKAGMALGIFLIILVAPIMELYLLVNK